MSELKGFIFNPESFREFREKKETASMLEMIDRELKQYRTMPELDFIAGYLAGRIKEKSICGLITDIQAEQLIKVLYSKYEVLRNLTERGPGK